MLVAVLTFALAVAFALVAAASDFLGTAVLADRVRLRVATMPPSVAAKVYVRPLDLVLFPEKVWTCNAIAGAS